MSEIRVVAPVNMGSRLVFDGEKYNVDISDVLKRLDVLEGKQDQSILFDSSSDLDQAIPKFGFSIMHGFGFVKGVPRNIYANVYKQPSASNLSEYMNGIDRPTQDWTGWQIANSSEVVQFIQEEYYGNEHPVNVWCRINTSGLREVDGILTVDDNGRWTDWVRVTYIGQG